MVLTLREISEKILEIEKKIDVNSYQIGDIDLWPVLRVVIYEVFSSENSFYKLKSGKHNKIKNIIKTIIGKTRNTIEYYKLKKILISFTTNFKLKKICLI